MGSRAEVLCAVTVTFLVLAWLTVSLRVFVRARIVKAFGLDDWLMIVSLGVFTIFAAFMLVGIHYGIGRHNRELSKANVVLAIKYQTLCEAFYIFDTMWIKLSVGFLLLRIIPNGERKYRITLYISMAICTVWTIVTFFLIIVQCIPVEEAWERTGTGKCLSTKSVTDLAYSFSAMDILFDWLFALIPVPMLWDVKMTIQLKISIFLILGLGVFASTATIVRLKYLVALQDQTDVLYSLAPAFLWTTVEIGIAICAASVSTLRPIFKYFHVRGFSASNSNSGPSNARANYGNEYGLGYVHPGQTLKSAASHGTHTRALSGHEVGGGGNNTSQESILEHGKGIHKRMDVEVRYEGKVGSGNGV